MADAYTSRVVELWAGPRASTPWPTCALARLARLARARNIRNQQAGLEGLRFLKVPFRLIMPTVQRAGEATPLTTSGGHRKSVRVVMPGPTGHIPEYLRGCQVDVCSIPCE